MSCPLSSVNWFDRCKPGSASLSERGTPLRRDSDRCIAGYRPALRRYGWSPCELQPRTGGEYDRQVRRLSVEAAVAAIPDGASVAIGRPSALALIRALIRIGRRDLHLVGVPTGDIGVELLVAAGCARSIETSGVDLGEYGQAPAFAEAVQEGRLLVLDST